MSSTSPQRRALPRPSARPHARLSAATVERVRLRVVPRVRLRSRAPRVPFVTLVSVLLLAGVIGLLLFNTSMQQASFDQTTLEGQAADLQARRQALELDLEKLRDPQRIALQARRLHMVPAPAASFIDLDTNKIAGPLVGATPENDVPVRRPGPGRPAVLDPTPIKVHEQVAPTRTGRQAGHPNTPHRDTRQPDTPRRGASPADRAPEHDHGNARR